MALTLHSAVIPGFIQTIDVMGRLLAKGRTFCGDKGIDLEDLASTRLHADMQPLRFQVRAGLHFAMGSLAALQTGRIETPRGLAIPDYAGLEALVAEALAQLTVLDPALVDDHAATEIVFHAGERRPVFTGQGLLLSFALPNLHFHATALYAILRMRGVPLEKRDYLGRMDLRV